MIRQLLALKVLLDYLQHMMTIPSQPNPTNPSHPSVTKPQNHQNRPRIDLSLPPMTEDDRKTERQKENNAERQKDRKDKKV